MKIHKALRKLKKGQTLASKKLQMYRQTKNDLLFWLLEDPEGDLGKVCHVAIGIVSADDWYVDNE